MELLLDYGVSAPAVDGAELVFMDCQVRQRVRLALGRTAYAQVERSLDTLLVVASDGVVITAAHRLTHIRR